VDTYLTQVRWAVFFWEWAVRISELKHLEISLVRHDVLATIILMCRVNDNLASYEIPRSVQFAITGRQTEPIWQRSAQVNE
jgi:hypothetical protein